MTGDVLKKEYLHGGQAFKAGQTLADNPWDDSKPGASRDRWRLWNDQFEAAKTEAAKLREGAIKPGDAVGTFSNHQPVTGPLVYWIADKPFPITQEMFSVMLSKIPTNGELIQNRMGRLISTTVDVNGFISSALVIYRDDYEYYASVVFARHWRKAMGL